MVSIKPIDYFLKGTERVIYTDMHDIAEIQYMSRKNTTPNIRKISKYEYVELSTGEIKEFNLSESRKDNINSLRQTFKKLAYLINANFYGEENELWITLTYERNEEDLKVVRRDFDRFIKRFRRRYAHLGEIEFIKTLEPQERGAWHMHMLVKFVDQKKIFIPNKFDDNHNPIDAPLFEDWEQGFVNIQRPDQTDNIGAYLTSYLRDVMVYDLEPDSLIDYKYTPGVTALENMDENGQVVKVKGGRLHMYPVGMNVFSKSKGIRYPDRTEESYSILEKNGFKEEHLTLRKSLMISDEDTEFETIIVVEQYNKNREDKSSVLADRNWLRTKLNSEEHKDMEVWLRHLLEKRLYLVEHRWELNELKKEFLKNETS